MAPPKPGRTLGTGAPPPGPAATTKVEGAPPAEAAAQLAAGYPKSSLWRTRGKSSQGLIPGAWM